MDSGSRQATLRKESRSHEEAAAPFNFSRAPLAQQHVLLPASKHKRQMSHAMEYHGVTVIVGETGCGKSTDSDPSVSLRKCIRERDIPVDLVI
jgi:HrpA-like RNA helicase